MADFNKPTDEIPSLACRLTGFAVLIIGMAASFGVYFAYGEWFLGLLIGVLATLLVAAIVLIIFGHVPLH
jgi:hypothetical protein